MPNSPRILMFDIESSNLNASFGYTLCIGYKWYGDKKVHLIGVDDFPGHRNDPTNDKRLVESFAKVFNEADMVCGWFSKRFDVPFLNTRLLYHGLAPLPPVAHIDLWETSRKKLKMHSNRLVAVADFFDVSQKTPVNSHWIKAQAGDKRALKYVKDHCKGDILTLESVYDTLLPLVEHPNVNIVSEKSDSCPKCGGGKLTKRGFSIAKTSKTQRYQCNSCGGWSRGRPVRVKAIEIR